MTDSSRWDQRYETGDLPWDSGHPDRALAGVVQRREIAPCRAFEFGCGTGTNAIWLARQGFDVLAVDLSPVAVDMARTKASAEGLQLTIDTAGILEVAKDSGPFGFVFDRGCLHSMDGHEGRAACAERVHSLAAEDGLWFSLMGSDDGPPRDQGPPRLSVRDIAMAVEPFFKVIELMATHFDSGQPDPASAWACLMMKR